MSQKLRTVKDSGLKLINIQEDMWKVILSGSNTSMVTPGLDLQLCYAIEDNVFSFIHMVMSRRWLLAK